MNLFKIFFILSFFITPTWPLQTTDLKCYFCSYDESNPNLKTIQKTESGQLLFDDERCLHKSKAPLSQDLLKPCNFTNAVCITTHLFLTNKMISVLRDCSSKGTNTDLKCVTSNENYQKETCYCNDSDGCNNITSVGPKVTSNCNGLTPFKSFYFTIGIVILTLYVTAE